MKNFYLYILFSFMWVSAAFAQSAGNPGNEQDMGELRQKAWEELFESKPGNEINAVLDETPGVIRTEPVVTEDSETKEAEKLQPIVDPARMRRQMRQDRAVEKREQQEALEKGIAPEEANPRLNFKGDGRLRREARRERAERIKEQQEAEEQGR